ncbi:phosphonate ABC transporter ATP-binding protein [Gorillibacterium sp. sgz5001074]|uniref:phosphonate ABC transporter ATP-binding protein n=1 Tax=Gorillibacterium sp. sgz5001074 TaxID=3446695 RepID=UPI003F66CDC7
MLRITALKKHYAGEPQPALDGIDLQVESGEMLVILGRSGAGKSTLIRSLNRLVEPDSGTVEWKGTAVTGLRGEQLRLVRGRMAMIFQNDDLLPKLDVLTNVMVGAFTEMPRWRSLLFAFTAEHRKRAEEALRKVGLQGKGRKRPDELSGGQKQRVAIARSLMQKPELLLGDEPVASLDPVTSVQIMELLSHLHRTEGLTLLLNLHDVELARRYGKRIIGLAGGRIVFDGPPESLDDAALQRIYPPDAE